MGKKRRPQPFQDESGADKPDYAADLFRGEKKPKKKAQSQSEESADVSVQDRLGKGMVDKLAALKAHMKEAATPRSQPAAKPALRKEVKPCAANDADASFAELFDPGEKDDSTFEELLKSSKLDWRSFKE